MTNFNDCIETILLHEGGYTVDHAGPTNFGVILPTLRRMGVFGDINHDGKTNSDDIRAMTVEDAKEVYKTLWWDKYHYGKIEDVDVATKLFSFSVNMGPSQAHKIVQRACNAHLNTAGNLLYTTDLIVDGKVGPKTFGAINNLGASIIPAFRSEAAAVYRCIAAKNESKYGRFLNGWLNRAYA